MRSKSKKATRKAAAPKPAAAAPAQAAAAASAPEAVVPVSEVSRLLSEAVTKALGQMPERVEVGVERAGSPLKHQGVKPRPGMRVVVRIAVRGHTYAGTPMERGRVLKLVGHPKDEQLLRLEYVLPIDERARTVGCRLCDGQFLSERDRDAHGARRHRDAERPERVDLSGLDPKLRAIEEQRLAALAVAGESEREDAEDKRILEETPPRYDRTAASMAG